MYTRAHAAMPATAVDYCQSETDGIVGMNRYQRIAINMLGIMQLCKTEAEYKKAMLWNMGEAVFVIICLMIMAGFLIFELLQ